MKKSPRIGFLLAPLAVPLAFVASVAMTPSDPADKDSLTFSHPLMSWVLVVGTLTLFSYASTFVLGFPVIQALRRLNSLSAGWVVLAGAVLGGLTLTVLVISTAEYFTGSAWVAYGGLAARGAFLGILVAASYCWLAGVGGRGAEEIS